MPADVPASGPGAARGPCPAASRLCVIINSAMPAGDERKPVTVLFAGVVGSTDLATRHDPAHVRGLLAAFFDEMRQQVEACSGTVEKYAGDTVVAVLGLPRR
jgi:class 3 adenylate cyclase